MTSIDFDGEYGLQYRKTIRYSIPGHDTLLEITNAAAATLSPPAARVLVIGPGPGDELRGLLNSLPDAHFTVLEPSMQMIDGCREVIKQLKASERCELLPQRIELCHDLDFASFNTVISNNVIHLIPPNQQHEILGLLADYVVPGGCLLISSYSEPADNDLNEIYFMIARERLLQLGMSVDMVENIIKSRGKAVFSLERNFFEKTLKSAGFSEPIPMMQGLLSCLWLVRKTV